jgi:citrate synthase
MSITLDSGHLTMKGSSKATIKTSIKIVGTNSVLPIEIVGEFKDIPQNLHQMYMQSMLASYGSVNVYDNTKEEPKTIEEQKSEWRLNRIVDIISKAITKK